MPELSSSRTVGLAVTLFIIAHVVLGLIGLVVVGVVASNTILIQENALKLESLRE